MKIKYRRFDDNDYTEVECDDFGFHKATHVYRDDTELFYITYDNKYHVIENVCEVYIEEL